MLQVERGCDDVCIEVDLANVEEVRLGADEKGQSLCQLILKDGSDIRNIIKTTQPGARQFTDPVVSRLLPAATATKIMV